MSRWHVVYSGGQIGKDGWTYSDLNLDWLPSNILAVQSLDGVTCEIEYGDRVTETNSHNDENVLTSSLDWWPQVATTYQAAWDQEQADISAEQAEQERLQELGAASSDEVCPYS